MVNFYDAGSRRSIIPQRRNRPSAQELLALRLIEQGVNTSPVQSTGEGMARLGSAAFGAFRLHQLDQAEKAREAAATKAIGDALKAADTKPWVNPDTGSATIPEAMPAGAQGPPQMVPTEPAGGIEGMVQSLGRSENPDVAPMALQLRLSDIERRQKLADALTQRRAEKGIDLEYAGPMARAVDKSPEQIARESEAGREPIDSAGRRAEAMREPIDSAGKRAGAIAAAQAPYKEKSEKAAVNFLTPDKKTVISYDGGRTYVGEDGRVTRMPSGSIRLGLESAAEESRLAELQRKAKKELEQPGKGAEEPRKDAAEIASDMGTGPFSNLAAGIDAVVGGLGIDKAFGKQGMFPETQDNRNALRRLQQLSKEAFIVSDRGAVWEQRNVQNMYPDPDTFWANPATEARKIDNMRQDLHDLKKFNLERLASGSLSPKEAAKVSGSNIQIDRALSMMGTPKKPSSDSQFKLTTDDTSIVEKYLKRARGK